MKKSMPASASAASAHTADSMVSDLFARVSEEQAASENQAAEAQAGTGTEDVSDLKAWVRFMFHICKPTVEEAGVFLGKNRGQIESHPPSAAFVGS